MLKLIKTVHTFIWAVMAAATFYILYAGLSGTNNSILWICIGLLSAETAVLLFNKWTCPLTPMAENYTLEREANFDIYLPVWLARHNKLIFGAMFVVGLTLVIINAIIK